jgi:hypothetical protein
MATRKPAYAARRLTTAAVIGVVLTGCGPPAPPPTFYLLSSTADTQLAGVERGPAVGVGPIQIPAYLERPQVVTSTRQHEVVLSERNQWAEPLTDSISRVMVIDLSTFLESTRVYIVPRVDRTTPLDYRVQVDVGRFDGTLGAEAVLGARWTLIGANDRDVLLTKVSILVERPVDASYSALIAAQNKTLELLSRDIADAILARAAP